MNVNASASSHFVPALTVDQLEALAAERPLRTPETFKPNDFYGHARLLKRYAGLPENFILRAVMPHGPSFCSKLWETELKDPCTSVLAISEQQRSLYGAQSPHKTAQLIGSPVLYAARMMEDELAAQRAQARGTIAFPTHSTHHVTVQFDQASFIEFLRALPPEFQPVRVCLYWRDIQLGRHRDYLAAGLECTTAGHMFDPEFVPRVLRLLAAHRQAAANKLGSCVYYAAALDLPVLLFAQSSTYTGPNPKQLAELSPSLDLPAAIRFAATAVTTANALSLEMVQTQRALARTELGAHALHSPAELRALLEGLPAAPPKPAPTPSTAASIAPVKTSTEGTAQFTAEATFNHLPAQLRPALAGQPRRRPGRIKLEDRPFAYVDFHSLYHQSQQIFGQKLYEFRSATDRPIIIDGGAHIGLASLFFARQFPHATIHAFEADPQIAAVLASNLEAFGLKKVQVHPQALWISNDGVPFAATADDSGHAVTASGASAGSRQVASVRLRDFLVQQPAPVDLLKLDIEGAEFAVLNDCDGALGSVRNILIEVHQFREGDGRLGELLTVLERNGFAYALGDLHAATWIESDQASPFPACKSPHYIVTVFAWRPVRNERPAPVLSPAPQRAAMPNPGPFVIPASRLNPVPSGPAPAPDATIAAPFPGKSAGMPLDAVLREALAHLHHRRDAEALQSFERALAAGTAGPRLQYGRSVALARLGRRDEALSALGTLTRLEPANTRAAALTDELARLSAPAPERLYIASYPRSGNTWLRLLLADVILQQHGFTTDTTLPVHADHIIPDLHMAEAGEVDRRLRLPCTLLKSHDRFDKLQPGRAVCIVRQAADSLVSYYHFHRRYPNLAAKAADGVDAFCRQHLEFWKAHLRSFLDARAHGAAIAFVAYETLHHDSVRVLQQVTAFIGLNADEATCQRAVENHTFHRQQAAEKKAHGDAYAVPFFRQGRVNGAVAELSSATLAFLTTETSALYQAAVALGAVRDTTTAQALEVKT
jgi:FkbM family methyltransferase